MTTDDHHSEDGDGRLVFCLTVRSAQPIDPDFQLGMLMFVVANLVGSSIQITTLPLPVLSTLQAV